ncbi:DUF456 family protein [Deferribacter autotrophicus]|uniref:DUF456 family protein n=1 Tax=Deferribacter autotrophicus TaxID=500465 RepID=A0A5A8F0S5_9BACT|nr:DUF456 domain-containing protein [Deferribacter autotrophicus]KAA0257668.1 DUF456 family protein [Deferribacter autotrophicus]
MFIFKLLIIIFQSIAVLTNFFGLPGNIISLVFPLIAYLFHWIELKILVIIIIFIIIGEILEFIAGYFSTKAEGLEKGTFTASLIVSIIFSILMAPILFGLGALIGAFLGAFVGAVIYEYLKHADFKKSLKRGIAVFKGRILGTLLKLLIGIGTIAINAINLF